MDISAVGYLYSRLSAQQSEQGGKGGSFVSVGAPLQTFAVHSCAWLCICTIMSGSISRLPCMSVLHMLQCPIWWG